MSITDNRGGASSGITSVNGQSSGAVVITPASLGISNAQVVAQGSAGVPLDVAAGDPVTLNTSSSEVLYLRGNGANQTISLSDFSGVKPNKCTLEIIVVGIYALLFQPGGNFVMNGNRRCVADSILRFISDGTKYIEDGGNEIS